MSNSIRTRVTFLAAAVFFLARPTLSQEPSQQKFSVAVLDFEARSGISPQEAATLSDVFTATLVSSNEFVVVDRSKIKEILEEQGFQQSEACSKVECIVEAGKILSVEKMFAGTIGQVGETYNLNLQVIDIATAQILTTSSRSYRGEIDDLATDIIPEMADEMGSKLIGREIVRVEPGVGWLWYVGGAAVLAGGAAAYMILTSDESSQSVKPGLPFPPVFPN